MNRLTKVQVSARILKNISKEKPTLTKEAM